MVNVEAYVLDAWLDQLADYDSNPYSVMCPCGCQTKFRYVAKGGEEEIKKHYEQFRTNYLTKHYDR